MQTTGTSDHNLPTAGVPPQQDRDEDSGLHDIRSMASSAKMRISSKRVTTNPPVDDDILASSSAGWKAVALPEPARMVSLPSIDQLPPVEDVKPSSERKSKKEIKAATTSASKIANAAIAVETSAAVSTSSSPPVAKPDIAATPIIGARFAQQQKKSKAGLYALIGTGIAAAAGVGWYVSTQMNSSKSGNEQVAVASDRAGQAPAPMAAGSATTVAAAPTVEPLPAEPEAKPEDTVVATGMAEEKPSGVAAGAAVDEGASGSKRGNAKGAAKQVKKEDKDEKADVPETKTVTPKPDAKVKDGEVIEGEPSFDALLKEAGVQDKKPTKVVLDKKSLSGADIKKGMSSIGGKAQACYAGTQGTAQVKLTVAPDGKVQKVTVTGVFAGTPVGACVEAAVKGATFPPWDGGPQSFGYSYLLAE